MRRISSMLVRNVTCLAAVLAAHTAGAAVVQPNDDFESPNPFVNYSGPVQFGGTMAVSTEQALSGTQSIKAVATSGTASNVFAATNTGSTFTEMWVRSYVYVDSITSDGFGGVGDKISLIGGFGAGGAGVPFNVFIAPDTATGGRLVIEMSANAGGGEGTFRTPNPTFETAPVVNYDQWHYVEAHWVNGPNDGDDGFEVYFNNADTAALSIGFTAGLSTSMVVGQINFGASAASVYNGGGTIYYDNYASDDANQIGLIPEPATLSILMLGGVALMSRRRM